MAFAGRTKRLNSLINVFWDENTSENNEKARAKSNAMTEVLKSFEPNSYTSHAYGNYSEYIVQLSPNKSIN